MKKTLITLALAGSFALSMTAMPLFAQDAPPTPPPPAQQGMSGMHHGMHHGRMTPEQQLEHLTHALNLTADQQSQIKPILVEQGQKMRAIWQDQSLTHAQRRDQMMAAMHQSKTQLEAVLNPDQKQKFEAMMHRRMDRMHQWQHGHNGPPSPQAMNRMHHGMRPWGMQGGMHHGMHPRGMTPESQLKHLTQALNLSAAQQAQLKTILVARNQQMRTIWKQQMQERQQERQQMRDQMTAAAHQSSTQLEAVLNPDQKQEFEAIMRWRMDRMHHWQHHHGAPPPPPQQ